MNGSEDLDFANMESKFDFMTNSQYKLFQCMTKLDKFANVLKENRINSIETHLLPAYLKLRDSKNAFYNSIYSIKHLYEQNKQKIERTCQKLNEENEQSNVLLETYSKLFVGTWSLLYIEYVMNKYLSFSQTYENYLEKVASFSDRYSTYTDVLSYYLSLTNVYEKLTTEYYEMLHTLNVYSAVSFGKANEISSHLLEVISKLEKYESDFKKVVSLSHSIQESILKLQHLGYNCSLKSVKTKYYIDSLLEDMIGEGVDKSIKTQPIHIQMNVIRNKIVLLRLVVSKLKF